MAAYGGVQNAVANFFETYSSGYNAGVVLPLSPMRLQSYFVSGTGADKVDGIATLLLPLVASTPQVINLQALTDPLGLALTVTKVRFIVIKNLSVTDGQILVVGGAGVGEFNGFLSSGATLAVYPSSLGNDGFVLFSAPSGTGYPVSGTSHLLKLDPGAFSFSAAVLIGTSSV